MKKLKSPVGDGLLNWGKGLKEEVAILFSMWFRKREITESWNNVVILFLLRKRGDKECVKNCRPINLSVVYKNFKQSDSESI